MTRQYNKYCDNFCQIYLVNKITLELQDIISSGLQFKQK